MTSLSSSRKGVIRREELGRKGAGSRASRSLSTPTESATEQNPSYFKPSTSPRNLFWDSFRISARQIGNASHHKYSQTTEANPEGGQRREPLVSHVAQWGHILIWGHHLHQVLAFWCRGGEGRGKRDREHARNSDLWRTEGPWRKCWNQTENNTTCTTGKSKSLTDKPLPELHRSKPAFYSPPSCSFLLNQSLTPLSCYPLQPSKTATPSLNGAQTSKDWRGM